MQQSWTNKILLLLVACAICALLLQTMFVIALCRQNSNLENANISLKQELESLMASESSRKQLQEKQETREKLAVSMIRNLQTEQLELRRQISNDVVRKELRQLQNGVQNDQLRNSRNDSVATAAAWNIAINAQTGRDEFFNFFEIRNRVEIPTWWRNELTAAEYTKHGNFELPQEWNPGEVNDYNHPSFQREVQLIEKDGKRYAEFEGKEFWVPEPNGLSLDDEEFIAFVQNAELAVFLIDGELLLTDWVVGECIWTKRVTFVTPINGGWAGWASIILTDDQRVFVFTGSTHGYSAHSLSMIDGKTLMEFKSN